MNPPYQYSGKQGVTKPAGNKKAISARKKPSQERSKVMVERILTASRELLKASEAGETPRLNTNLVAKQAGISPGSIYQYFPNIESILNELFEQMTGAVLETLKSFNAADKLALSREEFFDILITETLKAEADPQVTYAMHKVMKSHPALEKIEKQHAENVAEIISQFLAYYGSTWPKEKLHRLGLYIYYLNFGTWIYREHIRPEDEESIDWESNVMRHMIDRCFL